MSNVIPALAGRRRGERLEFTRQGGEREVGEVLGPRVLLVCTANICRSPAAERLLAARLGSQVEIFSRGVRALPGAPMCDVSANFVMVNGGDPGLHQSRRLELADIKSSTLILTASQRHRTAVIEMRPSAQVRTFTLAQAARIAKWRTGRGGGPGMPFTADLPDRLLWLLEEMDAARGAAPRAVPESADDLPDPHLDRGAKHPDVLAALLGAVETFSRPLLR
jgi:low molecular weight protein-tyrosine phosphatase